METQPESHGTRYAAAFPVPGTLVPDRGTGTARYSGRNVCGPRTNGVPVASDGGDGAGSSGGGAGTCERRGVERRRHWHWVLGPGSECSVATAS